MWCAIETMAGLAAGIAQALKHEGGRRANEMLGRLAHRPSCARRCGLLLGDEPIGGLAHDVANRQLGLYAAQDSGAPGLERAQEVEEAWPQRPALRVLYGARSLCIAG